MAETVKKAPKTKAKKKAEPKAAAPQPKALLTLESLDARIRQLEEDDVVRAGKRGFSKVIENVQERYEENPTLTIAVGVVLLILVAIIF